MSWQIEELTGGRQEVVQRRLRLGAIGSLGAVTLLWVARFHPILLPVGTVLMTTSLVALAAGFRARGGLLLGLLFAVLWIAAKLDAMGPIGVSTVLQPANLASVFAMAMLGVLSGVFFGPTHSSSRALVHVQGQSPTAPPLQQTPLPSGAEEYQQRLHRTLLEFREWLVSWNRQEEPWMSFDSHIRESLRQLIGARRVRCYSIDTGGTLHPLNGASAGSEGTVAGEHGLIHHVITTGRRFISGVPEMGPMVQELADTSDPPLALVLPIRGVLRSSGLITVEEFEDRSIPSERIELACDLIEALWLHLQEAENCRLSLSTDRPSGVLDRVEILSVLDRTIEECYANHEPVVMLALVVEGIRMMDDGGQWKSRNEVVEIIGQTMHSRLRYDDVVGRFSDDRFVAVLRRLDSALAHLITRKILTLIQERLRRRFPEMPIKLRAGLSGSGFERVPPQDLLLKAFTNVSEARSKDLPLLPYVQEAAVTPAGSR